MNQRLQRITPFLWFDHQAEEAAYFYVSVFPNSRILGTTHYDQETARAIHRPEGSVMTVAFELDGEALSALNGGPAFPFTPAVSLVVNCRTQDEIDHYWNALSKDGDLSAQQCGWLKDRYGFSWQIVPADLPKWLMSSRAPRIMQAVLSMKKLELRTLQKLAG